MHGGDMGADKRMGINNYCTVREAIKSKKLGKGDYLLVKIHSAGCDIEFEVFKKECSVLAHMFGKGKEFFDFVMDMKVYYPVITETSHYSGYEVHEMRLLAVTDDGMKYFEI